VAGAASTLSSAGRLAGLDADAWIEPGRGGFGAAADAGCRGLNLIVDGKEGVESAVDRGGVGEERHQGGVKDDEVGPLLQAIVVLTSHGCGASGRRCGDRGF
jgi:hypothetical protein